MTTPATSQPSGTPPTADPKPEGGTPPTGTPPATPPVTPPEVDVTTLSDDQLMKVLEHPNFFNIPRVKELREKAAEADKLKKDRETETQKSLEEQKKFEELYTGEKSKNETLLEQIKTNNINTALTAKLVTANVVDLDGALKLIDRTKVTIDGSGQVTGVDEALNALKTDKSYLFNEGTNPAPTVGAPSNPTNPAPGGPTKFKRSQLTQEFINANKDEVTKAMYAGMIEDDGPPPSH